MKKTNLFLLIAVTCSLFYSCQKEVDLQILPGTGTSGGGAKPLIGDYDFVGIAADTRTTSTVTESGLVLRSETTSKYNSTNNAGQVKFTATELIFKGVTYSVNTTAATKTYINGVLFGETSLPFNQDYPPYDVNYDYVRNNDDSLTFTDPDFTVTSPFSGGGPTDPLGARLSWSGDTLFVKTIFKITDTISQGGVPAVFTADGYGIMKFKKK
jgi:hypothetical protein